MNIAEMNHKSPEDDCVGAKRKSKAKKLISKLFGKSKKEDSSPSIPSISRDDDKKKSIFTRSIAIIKKNITKVIRKNENHSEFENSPTFYVVSNETKFDDSIEIAAEVQCTDMQKLSTIVQSNYATCDELNVGQEVEKDVELARTRLVIIFEADMDFVGTTEAIFEIFNTLFLPISAVEKFLMDSGGTFI